MIETTLSRIRVAALCLPLALVASCGSGSEAVQNTVVNVDPSAVAQPTTPTVGASLSQHIFTIELRSPTGYPQIGTELLVDTPSGGTLYTVDTSTTPPTLTPVLSPYRTTTGSNGVATVALDFSVGPGANGAVTVLGIFSGTAYGNVNVTYTCGDDNTADAFECPS